MSWLPSLQKCRAVISDNIRYLHSDLYGEELFDIKLDPLQVENIWNNTSNEEKIYWRHLLK